MNDKGRDSAQRFLAIIIIIAMMMTMSIPAPVVVFFAIVIYFVWRAVERSEQQQIEGIFHFYVLANEILRDEDRRWFGYEIAEVIERGEEILRLMRDPPPLVYFALGALYKKAGNASAAADHLSVVLESDLGNENKITVPSPELRYYVKMLRRLERDPAEKPQLMAAVRSLERMRQARAARLLAEAREQLQRQPAATLSSQQPRALLEEAKAAHIVEEEDSGARLGEQKEARRKRGEEPAAPPPITQLLREMYDEEEPPRRSQT